MPRRYKNKSKKGNNGSYQNSIMRKLFNQTTSDFIYTVRAINDLDAQLGAIELSDRTTAISGFDRLPLMLFPLRNILNGSATAPGSYTLLQNGYDFNFGNHLMETMGGRNIDAVPTNASGYETLLHRYTSIKLLFWQNASKDVRFNLRMVRFKNINMDPAHTTSTTNATYIDKRRLFFYFHCLRYQLTNPLLKNEENYLKTIKQDVEIIWEKQIHIQELSSTMDEKHYQEFSVYKKFDKTIHYNSSPTVVGDTIVGSENPDTVLYSSVTELNTALPRYNENLYLMITSNCARSDRNHATLYDAHTFDISLKSKYTTTTQNLANV